METQVKRIIAIHETNWKAEGSPGFFIEYLQKKGVSQAIIDVMIEGAYS